jgi:hypothetical protein
MRPLNLALPITAAALLAACGSSGTAQPTATAAPTPAATPTPTPAAHQAVVMINPASGKVGTKIHVTGSGYSPNVSVTGTICALDATGMVSNPIQQCDIVNAVTATTDASGAFTADYTVMRIPAAVPGGKGYSIGFGVQGDASNSGGAVFTPTP